MVLKYKKVRPGAALPGRATPGSAAADLRAVCGDEGVTLQPMGRAVIPTGIAVELPGPEYCRKKRADAVQRRGCH